ncbi:MAG: adenylyl-sulfate reductase subunit alpha [Deltaproteobacteria bacterium]|jgi:adenylylsulfate reductase subunit A|nr:adenylyl-sulfate reductase subunit alpha [Deltaproteobacteria bacterium]
MRIRHIDADLLIIGGGAAGCYAAIRAARAAVPGPAPRIALVEKAHIERSGCLAAGVNAINAYIGEGRRPEDYVDYASRDAAGIVRGDLLLSMARRLNGTVRALEEMGLLVLKDGAGGYAARGWRNVRIRGENIKPLLAAAVSAESSVAVFNRVNVTAYLTEDNRIRGAVGFGVTEAVCYVFSAPAVICATGGAAGLYRPNSPGFAGHALWYSPFNTGAGLAMGILAGAEMTTLEMRFVALRCKGSIAPTGTLAQDAGAEQLNRLGEAYGERYGLSTAERVYGTRRENAAGRGPCFLRAARAGSGQWEALCRSYLNMSPVQTLQWVEEASAFSGNVTPPPAPGAEIEGTEPYVNGGHCAGGYWVDSDRQTTLNGLFAAGDVAGGCPQKYVSGAMAEAEIAVFAALDYARRCPLSPASVKARDSSVREALAEAERFLRRPAALFTADQLEEAMQQSMDSYAGGIGAQYRYNGAQLARAGDRIGQLLRLSEALRATDMRELMRIYELRERLILCRSLLAHLEARRESRWPGFGEYAEYPEAEDRWLLYVNSRLRAGEVRILFRDLVGKDERYEHTH